MVGTYRGDIAILLPLLARARDRHEEDDDPWNADLKPHLEVDRAEARVETRAHEDVVDEVPGHANLVPGRDGDGVHEERHAPAVYHGDGHEVSKVVDDLRQAEDVVVVQGGGGDHGDVDTADGVALVHEGLVVEGRNGETLLRVTGHDPGEEELVDDEAGVDLPGVGTGASVLGSL